MKRLLLLALASTVLCSCMYVEVSQCGPGSVTVNLDKAISTSTLPVALKADGNTVPISAIP